MEKIIFFLLILNSILLTGCKDKYQPVLAEKPPLGWNSWDCFGMDVTEDQVKQTADYMARHMKSAGWEYVVIDMGWDYADGLVTSNYKMKNPPLCFDEYGRLIPNVNKFPSSSQNSGFKAIADYVHSHGLKFGIHIQRGIPWEAVEKNTPVKGTNFRAGDIYTDSLSCTWYHGMKTVDMDKPGAQEYYNSLLEQYSSWEVDFIKADDLGRNPREIEAISKAISKCGRPILLSIVGGGKPGGVDYLLKNNVQMWRITGDMWDDWSFVKDAFESAREWQGYARTGHWPDLDMLPVGKLRINSAVGVFLNRVKVKPEETINEFSRLTPDEQYTLLTLWSVFRSPMMMGGNLMEMNDSLLSMLTNPEVLEVNQNSTNNRELRADENEIVWVADDPVSGAKYLAVFNIHDNDTRNIAVTWDEIGIRGTYVIRDLWKKKDIATASDKLELAVAPHGCGFYKLVNQ